MTKKEQKLFIEDALTQLKDAGITIKWFLKELDISRTHWFFLKKAERPLTKQIEQKIYETINKKIYND